MPEKEILIAKKESEEDRIYFKIKNKRHNSWAPPKWTSIVTSKDPNNLAGLLYDLHLMGYPVSEAYKKFKQTIEEPGLWFVK